MIQLHLSRGLSSVYSQLRTNSSIEGLNQILLSVYKPWGGINTDLAVDIIIQLSKLTLQALELAALAGSDLLGQGIFLARLLVLSLTHLWVDVTQLPLQGCISFIDVHLCTVKNQIVVKILSLLT